MQKNLAKDPLIHLEIFCKIYTCEFFLHNIIIPRNPPAIWGRIEEGRKMQEIGCSRKTMELWDQKIFIIFSKQTIQNQSGFSTPTRRPAPSDKLIPLKLKLLKKSGKKLFFNHKNLQQVAWLLS
jgi:hypothetical protein